MTNTLKNIDLETPDLKILAIILYSAKMGQNIRLSADEREEVDRLYRKIFLSQ